MPSTGRPPAVPAGAPSAMVAHCIEMLSPLGGVRARSMFGGHGLYLDGLFIAIIAYDRLYLKADATTAPRFAAAGCQPFVYDGGGRSVTLNYWTVPAEAMESPAEMAPWARLALQAALAASAASAARQRRPARKKAVTRQGGPPPAARRR